MEGGIPKRISNYQKRDIDVLRIVEDVIAGTLHHLSICKNHFSSIVLLLLSISVSSKLPLQKSQITHQNAFID